MRSYPKSVSMGKQYNKKRKEKHMKKITNYYDDVDGRYVTCRLLK
mgnify:CR=1 FL=1